MDTCALIDKLERKLDAMNGHELNTAEAKLQGVLNRLIIKRRAKRHILIAVSAVIGDFKNNEKKKRE